MDRKINFARKLEATFNLTSVLFSFFLNIVRAFASIVREEEETFRETVRPRYNYRNTVYILARLLPAWVLKQHMCKQQ